jgi:uncharacterized protein YidB (DUF937 family)
LPRPVSYPITQLKEAVISTIAPSQEVNMGLLDILNGMQDPTRGQPVPRAGSGGGMSPITTAILGLLAYQAYKSFAGSPSHAGSARAMPASRSINTAQPDNGGGLGELLGGGLGSLLAGGGAGSVLSDGLNDLLAQFQQSGHGDTAKSWVSTGPNSNISANDLAGVLGADKIETLAMQSGMSRDELLQGLSQYLPRVVDQLTPNGRVPTEQEVSRLI